MENFRNRCTIDLIEKDETVEIIKQKSQLTFNGIHKSSENCDSYTFKQNEILMVRRICLGSVILELSKLHMYETYYDKLQPFFGQDKLQLLFMDCDSFVLSNKTENIIID